MYGSFWTLLAALLAAKSVLASEGDVSHAYVYCITECMRSGCVNISGQPGTCDVACPGLTSYKVPSALRYTQWDCTADCSYHCMWGIEHQKRAAKAGPTVKYHGKWPFIRVLGAQEIASVIFSIGNLVAHAHNLHMFLRAHSSMQRSAAVVTKGGQFYPYAWIWMLYSIANINAWLWSAVFHTRDTRITERFDYFSADALVAVGVLTTTVRVLSLMRPVQIVVLVTAVLTGLLQHVYYMQFVKFDYGYNMTVCVTLGILQGLAWLVWCFHSKHPARKYLFLFLGLVHLAMLLEVLDFPPLFDLFDAHAMWHAATIPLTYIWYWFVAADMACFASSATKNSTQSVSAVGASFEKCN